MSQSNTILEVRDLYVEVGSEPAMVTAVDGVSFQLEREESLGIAGASGSGKTMTAMALAGLFPSGVPVTTSGSVRLTRRNGEPVDMLDASSTTLRRIRGHELGMIFQEPASCLNPVLRIGFQIMEGLQSHCGLRGRAARARAHDLLERVRMPDPARVFRAFPHELSGGMQQRAMLAMALGPGPSLLVADEPTTALDATVQARILELLRELQEQEGMALILISHDLDVLQRVTDRVLVMRDGQVVDEASAEEISTRPPGLGNHIRHLLECRPRLGEASVRAHDEDSGQTLLEVRGLRKTYARSALALGGQRRLVAASDVTFEIDCGRTFGLVGESGAGKSTVARCLLRLEEPSAGSVTFQGKDWLAHKGARLRRHRRKWQAVFQDPLRSFDPRLTMEESLSEGLLAAGRLSRQEIAERVMMLIGTVGLEARMRHRYPHEFSGGERQRLAIARALSLQPALLVLDEPVSSLDVIVQAEILDLLLDLQARHGLSYLFISHDLAVVERMSDKIGVMHKGRLVECGDADYLLNYPQHPQTRQLLQAARAAGGK